MQINNAFFLGGGLLPKLVPFNHLSPTSAHRTQSPASKPGANHNQQQAKHEPRAANKQQAARDTPHNTKTRKQPAPTAIRRTQPGATGNVSRTTSAEQQTLRQQPGSWSPVEASPAPPEQIGLGEVWHRLMFLIRISWIPLRPSYVVMGSTGSFPETCDGR